MREIYRQGDIVFVREAPIDLQHEYIMLRYAKYGRLILSGETGNSHVSRQMVLMDSEYIVCKEPTAIEHPQHPTLVIPRGVYRVQRVRSWDSITGD